MERYSQDGEYAHPFASARILQLLSNIPQRFIHADFYISFIAIQVNTCVPCAMFDFSEPACVPLAINASAMNRTRVTSMATMYSTTRPLMLLCNFSRFCWLQSVMHVKSCRRRGVQRLVDDIKCAASMTLRYLRSECPNSDTCWLCYFWICR